MKNIVHLFPSSIFSSDYIEFVNNNFNQEDHEFIIYGNLKLNRKICDCNNTFYISSAGKKEYLKFSKKISSKLESADKIIIHRMFDKELFWFFNLNSKLLKKSYWIIWGVDLYHYKYRNTGFKSNIYEKIRKRVLRKIPNIITLTKGDYFLAKKWYKSSAVYYKAFYPYEKNYFAKLDTIEPIEKKDSEIIIQIGNSAKETNEHTDILDSLRKYREENIKIICPLSYGNLNYAKKVINYGKENFKEKFEPLTKFLNSEEYGSILKSVDVGIFNFERQQGFGNINMLLYMGKKVYIRDDITLWNLYKEMNIKVYNRYDIERLPFNELIRMEGRIKSDNKLIIKKELSENQCVLYWEEIFNS